MAATKYTYNQNVINSGLLQQRIQDSSIATALDFISTTADETDIIDVWFVDALSGAEETTLDGVFAGQDLEEAKVAKQKAINNYRDYKMYVVKYTWPTDSKNYDMDPVSQFKMAATLAYINAGNSLSGDFKWRDADNEDQAFTTQEFKDFGRDVWDRAEELHTVAKAHKDAVAALSATADANSYDYTTETPTWPE